MGISWADSKVGAVSAKSDLKIRIESTTLSPGSDEAYFGERYTLQFLLRSYNNVARWCTMLALPTAAEGGRCWGGSQCILLGAFHSSSGAAPQTRHAEADKPNVSTASVPEEVMSTMNLFDLMNSKEICWPNRLNPFCILLQLPQWWHSPHNLSFPALRGKPVLWPLPFPSMSGRWIRLPCGAFGMRRLESTADGLWGTRCGFFPQYLTPDSAAESLQESAFQFCIYTFYWNLHGLREAAERDISYLKYSPSPEIFTSTWGQDKKTSESLTSPGGDLQQQFPLYPSSQQYAITWAETVQPLPRDPQVLPHPCLSCLLPASTPAPQQLFLHRLLPTLPCLCSSSWG